MVGLRTELIGIARRCRLATEREAAEPREFDDNATRTARLQRVARRGASIAILMAQATSQTLERELDLALSLAREAGAAILGFYRKPIEIEQKDSLTTVNQ